MYFQAKNPYNLKKNPYNFRTKKIKSVHLATLEMGISLCRRYFFRRLEKQRWTNDLDRPEK